MTRSLAKISGGVPYTYEVKLVDQNGRPWEAEALASSALEAVSVALRAFEAGDEGTREVTQLSVRRLRILLSSPSSRSTK